MNGLPNEGTHKADFERKDAIDAGIAAFLARHRPLAEERVVWGKEAEFTAWTLLATVYASSELPPLAAITSVRAIVFHGDHMLALTDGDRTHIMPGGRRERGEAVETALRREVLEESGWTISIRRLLGFVHYYNLGPKPVLPPDHPYPLSYPDLFHPVYLAEALTFDPATLLPNESEQEPFTLRPITDVRRQNLTVVGRALLTAALGG